MNCSDSLICHRCFKDKVIIDLIRREGRAGLCDWCGARSLYVIPLHELGDMFRDVVKIYQPGDINGDHISYLLQEDWNIFSDKIEQASDNLMHDLTVAILKAGLRPKEYLSGDYPDHGDFFYRKEDWLVEHWHEMAEAHVVSEKAPAKKIFHTAFNLSAISIDELPNQLEVAFEDLATTYDVGRILHRARIHRDRFREECFNLAEMGAPPPDRATAGRANRKNEPVLYLASNADTAIAEVRAWKGMAVAIGRFEMKKLLSVVSFLNYKVPESPFNEENLEWKVQLAALFDRLAEELSRPALREEDENVYFSTQYLCDWVKKAGHDGIEYPSAMGEGFNVVLFDPANAVQSDIRYLRIRKISHKCETIDPDEQLYDEGPFDYLLQKQLEPKT